MTEYIVKIGFWVRAYDGFTVEANSDAEAIEKAKAAAAIAMKSIAHPEHIEIDERREGVIAFIDRITPAAAKPSSRTLSSTTIASTPRQQPEYRIIPTNRARPSHRALAFLRRPTWPTISRTSPACSM
ncbi:MULTISPECIES: hypothetical protein [Rhodomicrobium]|uniref:hypothetical protein n=1 Tax=Rhodomicrobium TaxID=1068 RepID=UPI001FD8F357|nr:MULTISPECIES: hypothetical protein [Rhodomicrobium]